MLHHHYHHHHKHFFTNCVLLVSAYEDTPATMQVFLHEITLNTSVRASTKEAVELLACNVQVPAWNLVVFLILSKQIAGRHLRLIQPPIPSVSFPIYEQFNVLCTCKLISKVHPGRSQEGANGE